MTECFKCKKKWVPLFNPNKEQARERLDYARRVGDSQGILLALAMLQQSSICPQCRNKKED